MLAPILLIRSLLPGMRQRGFGRIVNVTSAMVKSPRAHMGLSTAARTGLTAQMRGDFVNVRDARGTERMAFRKKAA